MKPKVLVEVENGVATASTIGDVDVLIVDYDTLNMGEVFSIPEAFCEAFPGLREAVGSLPEQIDEEVDDAETSTITK